MSVIRDGDFVVAKSSDGVQFFLEVKKGGTGKYRKTKFSVGPAIGQPYGSVFELVGRTLKRVTGGLSPDLGLAVGSGKDNRNLVDDGESQTLASEDIEKMRSDGVSGEAIIKELITNSATFAEKTEYSQQKYLKRKQKKYMKRIQLVKCTTESVCDTMFTRQAYKTCYLRPDMLGQILTAANVRPGVRCMVVETCMGLVAGAVAARMGGQGDILAPFPHVQENIPAMARFNLPREWTSIVTPFKMTQLMAAAGLDVGEDDTNMQRSRYERLRRYVAEGDLPNDATLDDLYQLEAAKRSSALASEGKGEVAAAKDAAKVAPAAAGPEPAEGWAEPPEVREAKWKAKAEMRSKRLDTAEIHGLLQEGVDSLIIVAEYDPLPLTMACVRFLKPSQSFAIYCQQLMPLARTYQALQEGNIAIKLELIDIFTRHQQVLPQRTHPHMMMNGASGYLLRGIAVYNTYTHIPAATWTPPDMEELLRRGAKFGAAGRERAQATAENSSAVTAVRHVDTTARPASTAPFRVESTSGGVDLSNLPPVVAASSAVNTVNKGSSGSRSAAAGGGQGGQAAMDGVAAGARRKRGTDGTVADVMSTEAAVVGGASTPADSPDTAEAKKQKQ